MNLSPERDLVSKLHRILTAPWLSCKEKHIKLTAASSSQPSESEHLSLRLAGWSHGLLDVFAQCHVRVGLRQEIGILNAMSLNSLNLGIWRSTQRELHYAMHIFQDSCLSLALHPHPRRTWKQRRVIGNTS